jgi:alkylation response protein AidB-like acyl-CoA dehydrogenase
MDRSTLAATLERVEAIGPVIRDGASESERLGCLAPSIVDALHGANLFRMLAPTEFGGGGLTIPESVAVLERIASYDASTGWTLAILAAGPLLARFLSDDACKTICSDPHGLVAGTLNPVTAQAERTEGGYVFSGRATYLSGSANAKWIMASALVMRDGELVVTDSGVDIRSGMLPIERAQDLDTWHVTGMRATGSTDYEFTDVEVADGWTFAPFAPRPSSGTDIVSWIPLWSQLGGGLAANAVGAARNMIDRFVELAAAKVPTGGNFAPLAQRAPAQIAIGEAQGLYQAARAVLFDTVDDLWARGTAHEPFDNDVLARHRLGFVTAVRLAANAIDLLHDVSGMNAVASDTVLDRCWRDIHTITQHIILSSARFEIAGRVLMGLDPASPVI